MDIETSAPSDGGHESISTPVDSTPAPIASTRDALVKAFDTVNRDTPAAPIDSGNRGPDGRFTSKAPVEPLAGNEPARPAAEPAQAAPVAPSIAAPQRFAKAAQDAWAQAPEPVRAEVARMEAELTRGIQEHQQRWEPLKRFDEMARSGGTTLDAALSSYVNMENMLRADPVRGMVELCKNMGVDPVQMAQALAGQQSSGGTSPEFAAMKAELEAMRAELSGVGRSFTERDTIAQVESFAKNNPRFDELSGDIAEMLRTGYAKDLPDAYAKAERLNPAPVQPAQAAPAKPAPEAQTRKASLSITGSPASGSNPSSRKPAGSTREALASAFAQVGLS